MKKVLAIVFAFALVFMCCACSSGSSVEESESVEDMVKKAAESRVRGQVMVNYSIQGAPTITSFISSHTGNTYNVSGKVSVKDKYGDSYSGNYDAVVEYDSADKDCKVTSFDLGNLYKK